MLSNTRRSFCFEVPCENQVADGSTRFRFQSQGHVAMLPHCVRDVYDTLTRLARALITSAYHDVGPSRACHRCQERPGMTVPDTHDSKIFADRDVTPIPVVTHPMLLSSTRVRSRTLILDYLLFVTHLLWPLGLSPPWALAPLCVHVSLRPSSINMLC